MRWTKTKKSLRLWGHRLDPTPQAEGSRAELFSCAVECRRKAALDPVAQAERNCCLPGVDTGTWTGEALVNIRMGAPPDYSREGAEESHATRATLGEWATPNEDIEAGGCPGAWYRTPFVQSLQRYRRDRDEQGGRIDNPALARADDFVIDCINAMEGFEDEARAEYLAARHRANKRE